MNILAYILWFIAASNALFAQGWSYNPGTNTWRDATGAIRPAPTPPPAVVYSPVPQARPDLRSRLKLER